jgi:1,4-alpha-glucan branching enzyme
VREDVYARDIVGLRETGRPREAAALETLRETYRAAGRAFDARDGDVAGALLRHGAWTSSATHAVLPLLATPEGLHRQLDGGIAAHRARAAGRWDGGLWLPECAYDPALDGPLADAGVRATCVELTDALGLGAPGHLRPYRTPHGTTLLPIDRVLMDLVWSDGAIPAADAYRDSHRRTTFDLLPWANDGSPWDPERARARARSDAAAFVAAARERVRGGGTAVVALDTEFLGHWWLEGPWWLEALLDEAAAQGLELVHADAVAAGATDAPPLPDAARGTTTWGTPRTLWTWSGPQVAPMAWRARQLELRVVARGADATSRAWRELLALQSSDWAFLRTRRTAGDYPDRRSDSHAEALDAELHALGSGSPAVRHLAPFLDGDAARSPSACAS